MSQFFELLISGLSLGCIYALIAMGFVVVFKATNVVNFAHASRAVAGGLPRGQLARLPSGSLGGGAVALAAGLLRGRRGAGATWCSSGRCAAAAEARTCWPFSRSGINIVLGTELARQVGTDLLPSGAPWGSST